MEPVEAMAKRETVQAVNCRYFPRLGNIPLSRCGEEDVPIILSTTSLASRISDKTAAFICWCCSGISARQKIAATDTEGRTLSTC